MTEVTTDNGTKFEQPEPTSTNLPAAATPSRKRTRKPAAAATVADDPPAEQPAADKPTGGRRINNTELIVMSDCWDCMADLPTAVQRRVVSWLDNQVRENEKADIITAAQNQNQTLSHTQLILPPIS
jgi:ABC-type uncharacterized transport system involved in gliding motility auxiliary subunit